MVYVESDESSAMAASTVGADAPGPARPVALRNGGPAQGADAPASRPPFRKLCGISLEAHGGGVCVGIGVNVLPPAELVAVGGKNAPAYLADLGFGFTCEQRAAVDEVAAAVLRELGPLYERWLGEGLAPLVSEYDAHGALAGRAVTVEDRNGAVLTEGIVRGIDGDGRLVVAQPDGGLHAVMSGEAHIR